jgi:tRNA A37 threonylcarbamoyladenosine dehydratase
VDECKPLVLGMGGVGSWAVEALARSGVGAFTLVDLDCVCITNVNRQVLASTSSVGHPKVRPATCYSPRHRMPCDVS